MVYEHSLTGAVVSHSSSERVGLYVESSAVHDDIGRRTQQKLTLCYLFESAICCVHFRPVYTADTGFCTCLWLHQVSCYLQMQRVPASNGP